MSESTSLGEGLPKEQERVRNIVKRYRNPELNGAGEFAARIMEISLANAEKAALSGDVGAMLRAYQDLKTWTD